jgi:hypothetical protein
VDTDEELEEIFEQFDDDRNGFLNTWELGAALQAILGEHCDLSLLAQRYGASHAEKDCLCLVACMQACDSSELVSAALDSTQLLLVCCMLEPPGYCGCAWQLRMAAAVAATLLHLHSAKGGCASYLALGVDSIAVAHSSM